MTKYLCWEPSLLGPVASIWHDMQTDGNGKAKVTLTPLIRLLDNDLRSIDELKLEFTYEKCMSLKHEQK